MKYNQWPRTLEEAIKICLLTMTTSEKKALKNTPSGNLIMAHFGWAVNLRNEFGMWQGNRELIESCGATDPDGASMVVVEAVWKELNR
jgi:hypothetical protein